MEQNRSREKRFWKRLILFLLAVLLLGAAGAALYLQDYYHATDAAIKLLEAPAEDITVAQTESRIDFIPAHSTAGIIFYPGGKVQPEAYTPLLSSLAEQGILCVMPKMPGNLAVLDMDAAESIRGDYPEITDWYLAGHSLGGAVAAEYLYDHPAGYRGLILLAAYSAKDLSQSGLQVLTICGSEDGVINREKLAQCRANLPDTAQEHIIEGGCHSYFGSYGAQEGDGTPTISREEQIRQTVSIISQWILPT